MSPELMLLLSAVFVVAAIFWQDRARRARLTSAQRQEEDEQTRKDLSYW